MEKKAFFIFQDRRGKLFLNLIYPRQCIDKFLSSLLKIHRQLSPVMWIAVWFQLNEREVHATDANCSWSAVFIASWLLLSVFVFEEAEEVKIWWNWGIQSGTSFARPWAALQHNYDNNQDECAFCPSVFQLFAGSEHSQGLLAVSHACSTSRFSLSGFLRHGYKKYLEIEEV